MNYFKTKKILTNFIIFLLSIQAIFPQKTSELIQPKCTNETIEYSILANMEEYLENENNIDEREFYSTIDDLKSKKVGTLSFFTLDGFTNIEKYNSIDDLMDALRKHKVDAIFADNALGNFTQIITNDLSLISGEVNKVYPAFVCEKNSTIYQKLLEFKDMIKEDGRYFEAYYKWMGIDEEGTYINKTITRRNGVLKCLFFNYPPYTFKDENGELVGSHVQFLYGFGRYIGFQVELQEATTIDDLNKAIKENTFDIVSYFVQGEPSNENSYLLFEESSLNPIIRYSNHPDSTIWDIYDSIEQFNGEKLGCLNKYSFEYLYKEKFPDSEVTYYKNNYDLLYFLLREEIEGFLTDKTIAKNIEKRFPERITYFDMNVINNIGLAFKKNDNSLLNEFNKFLEKQDVEKLYEKWDIQNTIDINVQKDNYEGERTIKVGLLIDAKPFCYLENEEIKGVEVDLLYEFARSKNYNIDFVVLTNSEDRMKVGEKDTDFDITGGQFTITEERAKNISFSDPIYNLGTALVVRKDIKKDTVKLTLFDKEYNQIPDNKAKLYSKVGNKTVTSFCAFPNAFDYTLIINCTINDLNGTDPFTQGIESTDTEDKLLIMYSDLEIDNILKANEKLNLPIIQESDKTEHICPENISPLIPAIIFGVATISLFVIALTLCRSF